MKFSDALTEYLQLRDDERDETDCTPIPQRGQRRERIAALLDEMDRLAAGVNGPDGAQR